MPFDLRIPGLGESVSEAIISRWVKKDGDTVGADDVVAELETDKATVELPAGQAGALKIVAQKGQTVKVGDVIAQIDPAKAGVKAEPAKTVAPPVPPPSSAATANAPEPAAPAIKLVDLSTIKPEDLSPAVRALVAEHGLANAQIPATGPKGNLTKEDVLTYVARNGPHNAQDIAHTTTTQRTVTPTPTMPTMGTTSQPDRTKGISVPAAVTPAPASAPPTAEEIRIEMSKLRQTIAQRLVQAQHATASLTTFNEIDMSAVMALREKYKERFEKTYNIGLGFMSFFAKAVINALKAVPNVNAAIEGTSIIQRKYVNLGIAVSTDRGLMVPVLRNAEKMSMAQIESEIKRLATKARDGKISPDEMSGGTFTVTNGGIFGSLLSTPILNPPQSGILGMHKIEKRAVVITEAGEDKIVIRPMMYVALTYDHRIIDGQQSVTFLVKVKEALEDPARLLLEV